MKPYNKRQLIGVARIGYDQAGKPVSSSFTPDEFKLNPDEACKLFLTPAQSTEDVSKNAQALFSAWFLKMENIETADRENCRVETQVVSFETWPDKTPKLCELALYFATTEPEPRRFTGVR